MRGIQRTHLQTFAGIGQRTLIGRFAKPQALHAAAEAGGIHHGEHAGQTLVGFTDQIALGAIEVQDSGGIGLDTHLVFQATAEYRVAAAVVVEFRHDEQRNPLHVFRGIRQTCQHQMNDVVGHVVFTGRNEDLGAGDGKAAITIRLGTGLEQAQIRTGVRFGQAHGAGPAAVDQFGQVGVFLLRGAMGMNGGIRAMREARIH